MRSSVWIQAARPKTLVATISPLLIGSLISFSQGDFSYLLFSATLLTALGIQICTNWTNDLFDFLKGADTEERKGPVRVVQSGQIPPSVMQKALLFLFTITALLGSYLVYVGGLPMGLLLALALLLAFLYTAGPFPLAYVGLGELFVLFFYGPVATGGTYYLQTGEISHVAWLSGIGPGLLSTALLAINNLRDIESDRKAGKKTLAARFGAFFGKMEYSLLLILAPLFLSMSSSHHPLYALLLYLPELPLLYAVWSYQEEEVCNLILEKTGLLLAIYTLLFFLSYG